MRSRPRPRTAASWCWTQIEFGKLGVAKALVVDGEFDKNFQLSARNLADVSLLSVAGINVYDIMRSDKLVLTTAAIKALEARLGGTA